MTFIELPYDQEAGPFPASVIENQNSTWEAEARVAVCVYTVQSHNGTEGEMIASARKENTNPVFNIMGSLSMNHLLLSDVLVRATFSLAATRTD